MSEIVMTLIIAGGAALVAGVAAFFIGVAYRKKSSEAAIGSAEAQATKLLNDAIKAADAKKKEALIEAKEEILKSRTETEKELKERRSEIQRQERRLVQKEENLDKKLENFEKKEELYQEKLKEVEKLQEEVELTKRSQIEFLEKISGFTALQAKDYIIKAVESEVKHEKAMKIKEIEEEFKDNANKLGQKIIALAIQKCAADYVTETTVSVVPLPNDEMKGRIIGREGRNIRTLETYTGVDLIIDDTPEAITLSSHDPIRREVARLTLEKLIADGRIHPARIEETVEKSRKEVDNIIKEAGERATFDTGIHGIHPELIKLLGKMKYRTSYGQNVLNHSIEVAHLSGVIAAELGVDVTLAKRAGLLHDIGKAMNYEIEGSHVQIGVDLAKKYKEHQDVIHAIEAHHGDVEAKTVIACIVQAADAISAARPGARRENLESYMKRLEKLEEISMEFNGVEKCFAIQAGREIRIMVKPEVLNDDDIVLLSHDIVKRIENELEYPGQIKVHVIREQRAIDYAK